MKHGLALAVLAALILLVCALPCSAGTIYVKWDSPGPTFNGMSWTTAYHTVGAAMTAAASFDEIWVARGSYSTEHINLKAGVSLYGGFAGTETARNQRNFCTNVVSVSGVTSPTGAPSTTRIDGMTIRSGIYCYTGSPVIANNTIVGYVSNGIYSGDSAAVIANNVIAGNGGGICCTGGSTALIANNTIVGNSGGGGAIAIYGGSPTIVNNIIAFNALGISRGGVAGTPTLRNNCIYGNEEFDYSGVAPGTGDISVDPLLVVVKYGNLHIQPSSPCRDAGDDATVQAGWLDMDCQARIQGFHVDIGADESDGTIWPAAPAIVRVSPTGDNSNDGSSWALAKQTIQAGVDAASALGGEVWVKAGTYSGTVRARAFAHLFGGFAGTEITRSKRDWSVNKSIISGGVAFDSGEWLSVLDGFTVQNSTRSGVVCDRCSPVICNNTIVYNSIDEMVAPGGGGILCSSSSALIANNTITWNRAISFADGGGIWCYDASPVIIDNIIAHNSTSRYGGGISCRHGSQPVITNNTVVSNTATLGGGALHCADTATSAAVSNNVIAFNDSGIRLISGVITLRNNDVYGNTAYNYSGVAAGVGDISADPLFVNRLTDNYHLTSLSPCIDAGWNSAAGLPSTDMDNESRTCSSTVDIGADEYWPTSARPSVAKALGDGTERSLQGFAVSAAFDGFLYIEAADRNSGIRVDKANHGVHAGDKVTVSGALATNSDGERFIQASAVVPSGIGLIEALLFPNRSVGGGDWLYNPVTGAGQRGQADVAHLNNIGLLVSTTGEVTHTDTGFFYLNDGSSMDDGSGYIGVKVTTEGLSMPAFESYVKITGASSCYKRDGDLFRLIRAIEITEVGP